MFTRKNLMGIALSVFYSVVLVFVGACLDGGATFMSKKNPINMLAESVGFKSIIPGLLGYLCLILVALYITIMAVALIFETRYATVNNIRHNSRKMVITYAVTVLVCVLLSVGLGILCQRPLTLENVVNMLTYIGQSMALASAIYLVIFLLVGAAAMLVVNFVNVDKPFRFFDKKTEPVFDDDDLYESNDVKGSFDIEAEGDIHGDGGTGAAAFGGGEAAGGEGIAGAAGESTVSTKLEIGEREKVFPTLTRIDIEHEGYEIDSIPSDDLDLEEICQRFRNYLAKEEKLYFDIDVIRFFISGMAASHFEILEGLSGTGKSSLPRYFAKFVNGRVLFMPVQATWRDKSSILGFFNEFSNTYSETEFLAELYHANYNPDLIHMFVLDEMNISRVEYYFADLLSVLEYPKDQWRLKIMQLPHDFIPPIKLEDGNVRIPTNSYFVGTANKDDSTFTITDKVYDRAITIEFGDKNTPFEVEGESECITLGASRMEALFDEAKSREEFRMTEEDFEKLSAVCDYVYDQFGIAIGNRIINQITNIVPVFVACGGTKEAAIDFMLSKKLVAKIEGRFEDYVKDALTGLIGLMNKTYGEGILARTEHTAKMMIRSL